MCKVTSNYIVIGEVIICKRNRSKNLSVQQIFTLPKTPISYWLETTFFLLRKCHKTQLQQCSKGEKAKEWPGSKTFWPGNDLAPLLRWRRHFWTCEVANGSTGPEASTRVTRVYEWCHCVWRHYLLSVSKRFTVMKLFYFKILTFRYNKTWQKWTRKPGFLPVLKPGFTGLRTGGLPGFSETRVPGLDALGGCANHKKSANRNQQAMSAMILTFETLLGYMRFMSLTAINSSNLR